MNQKKQDLIVFSLIGTFMISMFSFLGYATLVAPFINHQTSVDCVVVSKTAEYGGRRSSNLLYKINTENCGTFEIKDTMVLGDYNTVGRYNSIDGLNDVSYDFETYGYNILGLHPVITSYSLSEK